MTTCHLIFIVRLGGATPWSLLSPDQSICAPPPSSFTTREQWILIS